MLTFIKNLKIVSSMTRILDVLSFFKSALTVGIIVFTVLEALSAVSEMNLKKISEG